MAEIWQKLRIRDNDTLLTRNAPPGFSAALGTLPAGVRLTRSSKSPDQVHWFVRDRAQMEKELKEILPLVQGETICWIYYPKGTSKIQTDLTRDKGWDALLREDMQWINLISFDDTWSAFGMRKKTDRDRQREEKPKERAVFDYVDPVTRTVHLPEDLAAALGRAKKEQLFFDTLSFTNKKEYIEWIVSAKRPETRLTRVEQTIERLGKQWKNPANRK